MYTPADSTLTEKAEVKKGTFKDCPDCPEMVVIPAGSFDMVRRILKSGTALMKGLFIESLYRPLP